MHRRRARRGHRRVRFQASGEALRHGYALRRGGGGGGGGGGDAAGARPETRRRKRCASSAAPRVLNLPDVVGRRRVERRAALWHRGRNDEGFGAWVQTANASDRDEKKFCCARTAAACVARRRDVACARNSRQRQGRFASNREGPTCLHYTPREVSPRLHASARAQTPPARFSAPSPTPRRPNARGAAQLAAFTGPCVRRAGAATWCSRLHLQTHARTLSTDVSLRPGCWLRLWGRARSHDLRRAAAARVRASPWPKNAAYVAAQTGPPATTLRIVRTHAQRAVRAVHLQRLRVVAVQNRATAATRLALRLLRLRCSRFRSRSTLRPALARVPHALPTRSVPPANARGRVGARQLLFARHEAADAPRGEAHTHPARRPRNFEQATSFVQRHKRKRPRRRHDQRQPPAARQQRPRVSVS